MITTLRDTCRRLLRDGKVDVVIGYGQDPSEQVYNQAESPGNDGPVFPVFIQMPDDVDQLVWNEHCQSNLAVYLKRPEVRSLGRPAIVVKGCDQRALVVLEKESQLDRGQVYVMGRACDGTGQPKCEACDVHEPRGADVVIGKSTVKPSTISADRRYAAINAFLTRS